jgi:predicted nucleic acid-binding protein
MERSSACRKAFYCMPMAHLPQEHPLELVRAPPIVVLDTNVVLDLLLFRNPQCVALQSTLGTSGIRWVATAAMRDELAHVLARGNLGGWAPDLPWIWSQWDRHCVACLQPERVGVDRGLRCTDPDDQKFIDLALACQARWLVSRDRAVLELASRLRERGVQVVTPAAWSPLSSAG